MDEPVRNMWVRSMRDYQEFVMRAEKVKGMSDKEIGLKLEAHLQLMADVTYLLAFFSLMRIETLSLIENDAKYGLQGTRRELLQEIEKLLSSQRRIHYTLTEAVKALRTLYYDQKFSDREEREEKIMKELQEIKTLISQKN